MAVHRLLGDRLNDASNLRQAIGDLPASRILFCLGNSVTQQTKQRRPAILDRLPRDRRLDHQFHSLTTESPGPYPLEINRRKQPTLDMEDDVHAQRARNSLAMGHDGLHYPSRLRLPEIIDLWRAAEYNAD
jgi:hypothetical protein